MSDFCNLSSAVESVMSTCFSGTLEELKNAIKNLLIVDSPNVYKKFNNDVKRKDENNNFSVIELTALESIRDSKQRSVAHIAAAGGNINILQILLTASPSLAYVTDIDGETPLFYAIRAAEDTKNTLKDNNTINGRIDCLLLLIGHCGPNAISNRGISALHTASELGDVSICKLLIENNANVDIYSSGYGTPLCIAVVRGYVDVIKLLLEHGADVNGKCKGKCDNVEFPPPLVFASSSGQTHIVEILLESGADVNITDYDGWTSLHCAAEYGHYDVIKLLLEYKPDCNLKNEGKNAYHVALLSGRVEIANMLKEFTEDTERLDFLFESEDMKPIVSLAEEFKLEPTDELEETIKSLKDEGNRYVKEKNWINAIEVYTKAISLLNDINGLNELNAILHSNRSHTYLQLHKLDQALNDAKECIRLNESWSKGYIRLANVYKERGEIVDYLHCLFQGYTRDLDNIELRDRFRNEFELYKK